MLDFDMWEHRCGILHKNNLTNKVQDLQAINLSIQQILRLKTIGLKTHARKFYDGTEANIFMQTPKFGREWLVKANTIIVKSDYMIYIYTIHPKFPPIYITHFCTNTIRYKMSLLTYINSYEFYYILRFIFINPNFISTYHLYYFVSFTKSQSHLYYIITI